MAARSLYGANLKPHHTKHFREIFEGVLNGSADFGVVPIENALAGSVHENYDLLGEYPISIVAERYLPVQLHLQGTGALSQIRRVYSHQKALEQCSIFFEQHPGIEAVVCSDTSGAASHVRDLGDPATAAIASEEAATIYQLPIIRRSVQNHTNNTTRFIALAKTPSGDSNPTKCSILVSLAHEPGSLYGLLGEVAQLKLNLTKIESRPILGTPFSYSFHIDLECDENGGQELKKAIELSEKKCEKLRVLGFYRRDQGRMPLSKQNDL
jgi:prephenate dehydratase